MWRHVGDNPRFIVLDEKKSTGNSSANNYQDLRSTSGNGTSAKTEDSSDGLGLGNQGTIHILRMGGWVGLKIGNLCLTFSKGFSTVFILSYIVGGWVGEWVAQKKFKIMLT